MRFDFTEREILNGKNHADLYELGDFAAEYIEGEGISYTAYGILTNEGGTREAKIHFVVVTDEEIDDNWTAGEVFNLPWDTYEVWLLQ